MYDQIAVAVHCPWCEIELADINIGASKGEHLLEIHLKQVHDREIVYRLVRPQPVEVDDDLS